MRMARPALTAADLDPELLAALRMAIPDQIGDDLVLRVADGRIFFIDGFFALDGTGDSVPPLADAIQLAAEIADLLLAAPDLATAAGEQPAVPPESSGIGLTPFDPADTTTAVEVAPEESEEEAEETRSGFQSPERSERRAVNAAEPGSGAATGPGPLPLSIFSIGTISIAAGGAAAPTWQNAFDLRRIAQIEELKDPAADGWFPGLDRLLPMAPPPDIDTFALRLHAIGYSGPNTLQQDYRAYLEARTEWLTAAGGRTIWANLTPAGDVASDRRNDISDHLPPGVSPDGIFQFGDFIIGAERGEDHLFGFAGNDILVGYGGANHLFGGTGDDILVTSQGPEMDMIDGGDGEDTLIFVVNNETFPFRLQDLGVVTGVERLLLLPQSNDNPDYLNDDFASGRIVKSHLQLVLDAASIHSWGGHLTIDGTAADIRLADLASWARLPEDPAKPGYVHYQALHDGAIVTLSIIAAAQQPIADRIVGTAGDDRFFLGGISFNLLDGGAGNDQVSGRPVGDQASGLQTSALGTLHLADAALVPFRNIEQFVLSAPSDALVLSAAGIATMTDARKTLWVTGVGAGFSYAGTDLPLYDTGGTGQVHLLDPALWSALGYVSMQTGLQSVAETRMGAVYGATFGGQNVYLVVHVGITQPLVGTTTAMDHWFVRHDGWISLPPVSVDLSLSVIDLDNNLRNWIGLTIADAARLAGPDRNLSLIGDTGLDTVHLLDMPNWRFVGSENGFSLYEGSGADGAITTLRIAADLLEPTLLPIDTGSDLDLADLTNGRQDFLLLDVVTASKLAGANQLASVAGDPGLDTVGFTDQENWQILGRDGEFFVYSGQDGGSAVTLRLHVDLVRPTLLPAFTDGDDNVLVVDLMSVDQYMDLDGKDGFDILQILDSGKIQPSLDFIWNIEAIDLSNGAANSFAIAASTLVHNAIQGPLYITGDSKDSVYLDPSSVVEGLHEWQDMGTTVTNSAVSSNPFNLYQVTIHYPSGDVTAQVAIDQALIQPALPL
jgi:Ca2+-binding RTX toxin-like protein